MDELDVKKDFTDIYTQNSPHEYLNEMQNLRYRIPDFTKPLYESLAEQLYQNLNRPINILDLGSGYGINSALLTFDLTMSDLENFFLKNEKPPTIEQTEQFFAQQPHRNSKFNFYQIDISAPALKFSEKAGLCKGSLCVNLENQNPNIPEEFFPIDLVIATGCIGYIGYKSFERLFEILNEYQAKVEPTKKNNHITPMFAFSILRIFPIDKIAKAFDYYGFTLKKSEIEPICQRRFVNEDEMQQTISLLQDNGIATSNLEETGSLFADFHVGCLKEKRQELVLYVKQLERKLN